MENKTIVIGIAGATASGKTLLADTLLKECGSSQVVIISEDSYYKDHSNLSLEERALLNYDHPEAFEHSLLCQHVEALKKGDTIHVPVYDFSTHTRSSESREIGPHHIIILEGILLFSDPKLREQMDICVFMDTPLDVCLTRRLRRDIIERERSCESVITQYLETVRPMHFQFIEPSKRYADIIVPRGGENRIAIDIIKAIMREVLSKLA